LSQAERLANRRASLASFPVRPHIHALAAALAALGPACGKTAPRTRRHFYT
jgi:hypothetical protein